MGFLPPSVERLVDLAIEEDLGRGDPTSRLTIPPKVIAEGRAMAKTGLICSGSDVFEMVMNRVDAAIQVVYAADDGSRMEAGENVIVVRGSARSLLMAERVSLNFLQRLCGVATVTRQFVDAIPKELSVRLTDTRKTTPGLRFLERRAVLHGGAMNHRADLGGGILIKENHIAAAGSIRAAVEQCKKGAPHPLRIQTEVQNMAELKEALSVGVDGVLLDNMSLEQLRECVAVAKGKAFIEASGGIDLSTIGDIARTGVDAISAGRLTHSAPSSDISFLISLL